MTSPAKPEVHDVLSSDEDRATTQEIMYGKFREVWTCGFLERGWTGRQTNRHPNTFIAKLRTPAGGVIRRTFSLRASMAQWPISS